MAVVHIVDDLFSINRKACAQQTKLVQRSLNFFWHFWRYKKWLYSITIIFTYRITMHPIAESAATPLFDTCLHHCI